jgi:hypothetical protein
MSFKNGHKKSPAAVVSSVTAEMLRPRVAESAKKAGIKKEYAAPEAPGKRKPCSFSSVRRGASPVLTSPAF